MPLETLPWDIQHHLVTAEGQVGYLQAALEDGDPALIAAALSDVAEARGMSAALEETGLPQEMLASPGDPPLGTVMRAVRALGLRFAVTAAEPREPRSMEPA